jgi:hypothetical protein
MRGFLGPSMGEGRPELFMNSSKIKKLVVVGRLDLFSMIHLQEEKF